MNSKSKKRSPILLIASISLLLLVGILGSVYYKLELAEQTKDEPNVQVEQPEGQQLTEPVENNDLPEQQPSSSEQGEGTEVKTGESTSPSPSTPAEQKGDIPTTTEKPTSPEQSQEVKSEIVNGYVVGQKPATEPTYINGILIVNKKNPLPAMYNKGEDPKARAAFEQMATAAKTAGFELIAFSGFRSYEYQTNLYNRYVSRDGKDAADRYSARPGYSEHQSGLAFDVGEKGKEDLWLTSEFGETPAGKWLVDNAHNYGFILRYPKGKEEITGFMYESWHFRYLEGDLATKVYKAGVTLEEFLGLE